MSPLSNTTSCDSITPSPRDDYESKKQQSTSGDPPSHPSLNLQQQQRGALAKVKTGSSKSQMVGGSTGAAGGVDRRGRQTSHTQQQSASQQSAKIPRDLKATASKEPFPGDTR